MQSAVVALVSLLLTSLTLTALLFVGWRSFGRPRHALIWSGMFAARSAEWAVNLAGRLSYETRWHWYFVIVDLLAAVSGWLLVAGFSERESGQRPRLYFLAALGAASVVACTVGAIMKHPPLSNAPMFAFSTLTVVAAAYHLSRRRLSASPAQAVTFVLLALVALYYAVGTAVAVSLAFQPDAQFDAFRLLLVLGMPASSIAIGASCIFLIASDLAEQMRSLALADPLTGIFNRRGLRQAAEPLIAICRRHSQPLTVVIADLDRFKQINDRFGHATGDILLKAFAAHASLTLRRGDLFGRIGGEEFAFLLPNATPAQAREAMERLRCGIPEMAPIDLAPLQLTASFGIASLDDSDAAFEAALARADAALYTAKETGRDRVVIAPGPAPFAIPVSVA